MKQSFNLDVGQYLSDVADKIPTTSGLHLIVAPTGAGKTHHMMTHAEQHRGAVCFPVIAIKDQKIMDHKPQQAAVIQLEKLSMEALKGRSCLHLDECQILYTAGYRGKTIDNVFNVMLEFAKTRPVYLYTATANPELLPFKPDSVTTCVKPLGRRINLIEVAVKGCMRDATAVLTTCIEGVYTDDAKPVLCFVDNRKKCEHIRAALVERGLSAIALSSDAVAEIETKDGIGVASKERQCYEAMLSSKTVAAGGYDVVLSTCFMAEGIDFHDNFHLISTQAEPGLMFQQQGRARGEATHWMIYGEGDDRLYIDRGQCWATRTREDGTQYHYNVDDESVTGARADIKATDPRLFGKMLAHNLYSSRAAWGMYGVQIREAFLGLSEGAYTAGDHLVFKDMVAKVKSNDVGKTKQAHALGLGVRDGTDSEGYRYLLSEGVTDNMARIVIRKLVNFSLMHERLTKLGVKASAVDFFRVTRAETKTWIAVVLDDAAMTQTVGNEVAEAIKLIETGKGGRVTGKWCAGAADVFWSILMPKATQWDWWLDSNGDQRVTMFKLLIGLVPDGDLALGNWKLARDAAWWQVPLSNAEGNKYRARAKTITDAGGTVEVYHDATGKDRKALANTKPKDLKDEISGIDWGI